MEYYMIEYSVATVLHSASSGKRLIIVNVEVKYIYGK